MSDPILKEYNEVTIRAMHHCNICHKPKTVGERMIRKKFRGRLSYVNYVCLECEEKLKRGEIMDQRKYHIGDLVRYQSNDTGNPDLNGMVGTVIYVDSRDYTVEFPVSIHNGVTDYRAREIGIEPKLDCDWFCREEHLEIYGGKKS